MRLSTLFSQTLRDDPSDAEVASHRLLLRAGYIRQLAAGVFSYLPLGLRALEKIEQILRQEIDTIGGQEVHLPVVQPAGLWKESGRWDKIDAELTRFKDRTGRDLVLGMTHEEVIADLVRKEVRSYRQLPRLLYQIQTKWRDDPRPRAGLIRAREFIMKDSYSLDADWEGLERQYRLHFQAYFNIFHRCGLNVIAVQADTGIMGGRLAHEFMYLTPIGEDTLLLCPACGYSANRQVARFRKPQPAGEALLPVEKIATPDCKTIQALAEFLGVPESKTAKAVFLVAEQQGTALQAGEKNSEPGQAFVFAVVRGDMEVNETKLANAVNARSLRPATEAEIRSVGAVPGYASPLLDPKGNQDLWGLGAGSSLPVILVVDDLIPHTPNLVSGANEAGYHLLNVNYGRDYEADIVADITAAGEADPCPECSGPLYSERGVEVGNIFQLGTHFSESMSLDYLDRDGQPQKVIMGSYGIGIQRLLACIAEERHDESGLAWPVTVAPYQVHLILLSGKSASSTPHEVEVSNLPSAEQGAQAAAEWLYRVLWQAGVEVLYDDRPESPGVKFKDADLIGLPLRLTVGERGLSEGGVELKRRDRPEKEIVRLSEVVARVRREIDALVAEIQAQVGPVPYKA